MATRFVPDSVSDDALLMCKLERESTAPTMHLPAKRIVLFNSLRSTPGQARQLRDKQYEATGIEWDVVEA